MTIEVEMDSACGPRVVVHGLPDAADVHQADEETAAIEAEVPAGWEVSWGSEVRTSTGGLAYALVRQER